LLKHIFGLPFFNLDEVKNAFVFDLMSCDISNNSKVLKYATYLMDNYVMIYVLYFFHVFGQNHPIQYYNSCEALFQSKFDSMLYSSYPDILQFVEVIKNFQYDVYIKINKNSGKLSKTTLEKHLCLSQKLNAYKNGQISRFEFLKTVSFKFLPNM